MFNAVATESGHLGSLDSARITKTTSHLFGAYFQAELAHELRALGIRVSRDERGKAVIIDAIPDQARDLFSKRAQQAQRLAKAFVKRQGGDWRSMSADQKFKILHQANLTYRSKKYNGSNEREIWREGKDAGLAANAPACMTGTGRQRTVPLPMRRPVKQETGDPACLGGKLQPA
jgi:hypothetical protein